MNCNDSRYIESVCALCVVNCAIHNTLNIIAVIIFLLQIMCTMPEREVANCVLHSVVLAFLMYRKTTTDFIFAKKVAGMCVARLVFEAVDDGY